MNHDIVRMADEATAAITTETPREQVQMAIEYVAALKEATRQLAERAEAKFIEWIQANGELECGEVRYYVGPNKTTRCKDLPRTLQALLNATGGDFAETVRHLSTSAFKHGACRETLDPNTYADLFETTEVMDLKEGKPKGPRLQKFDAKFVRPKQVTA